MADRDDIKSSEGGLSPTLIAGIVVALAAVDFIVQNRQDLTIHFLVFTIESKVWTALVVTSLLAIVAAELVGRHLRRQRRKK
jgi:hypothetical protein